MKNFNASGMLVANEMKRQAAEAGVLSALQGAGPDGMSVQQIVIASDVSDVGVRNRLRDLHARQLVHISAWSLRGTRLVALYALGPGDDAKPEDFEHLRSEKTSLNAEAEVRKEAERRHAKWAKNWRPRRPDEAAWI